MKTAILDSSVWVSFILKHDKYKYDSDKIIEDLIRRKKIILLPAIVVVEICASAKRVWRNGYNFNAIYAMLHHPQIKIINLNTTDLLKTLGHERFSYLRSGDYLVLLYWLKFRPDYFITFDNKQRDVYNKFRLLRKHEN